MLKAVSTRSYKILGSLEAGGHTHDLTVGDVVAAVDIVVDTFRGHDHVEWVERNIGTAGAARGDDQVRRVVVDHFHGTNGSIDFANATLLHDDLGLTNISPDEILVMMTLGLRLVEQCLELRELLVHCDNDANLFHLSMIFVSLCACNIVGGGRNAVQSYKKKVLSPLLTPAF